MNKMSYKKLKVVLGVCMFVSMSSANAETQSLIDDELSQFQNVYDYGHASVSDGIMELRSTKNFFLLTKKSYKNFILSAEVKVPEVDGFVNSGIMFRAQLKDTGNGFQAAVGYQAEVDPSERKWSGGLYDQARRDWLHPTHPTRSHPDEHFIRNVSPEWTEERANAYKSGEWNTYRIEARGSNIKIYLNDILITHVIDTKDQEGLFGFQNHGKEVLTEKGSGKHVALFRNITVQDLGEW